MQTERILILVLMALQVALVYATGKFTDEVVDYCKASQEKLEDLYKSHQRLWDDHQRLKRSVQCRRRYVENQN